MKPADEPEKTTSRPASARPGDGDAACGCCTHRMFVTGLVLFGIIVLAAVLAPWIAPVDPNQLAMRQRFLPPGADSLVRHRQFRPQPVVAA